MHHSAVLTVNRVVSSGDGFQRFTAVVAGSQRVDQMVTFASTYAVAPGEVYKVSAVAPPEVMRDSYGVKRPAKLPPDRRPMLGQTQSRCR